MRNETLGGFDSIEAFVEDKLARLNEGEASFAKLFEIMFSEKENIMYERSRGYKLELTTYGEAYGHIKGRAASLAALLGDVPRGSVIGLYAGNSLEWIELFWAILYAGHRPILMNTRLDSESLCRALRSVGAAAVISEGPDFPVRTIKMEDVSVSEPAPPGEFGGEILVMSSGTTANVKLCAYTAEEFRRQIGDSCELIRRQKLLKKHYEGRLKLLAFLPFYHVFGLIAVYLWFGFFSRTFVHLNDLAPQTILGTIKRHKVTHIFAVPLFWEKVYEEAVRTIRSRGEDTFKKFEKGMKIADRLENSPILADAFSKAAFREVRENLFGDSISFMITGGSEISCDALRFFNAIGYRLADGYGMTEIGITSVELSDKRSILNAGYVGEPLASVEYSLSDRGELLVRGKSLARYIIEGDERRENSGWFLTGDFAACENGHYRILGRLDDLVITPTGENLNPNLIEPKFNIAGVRRVCLISEASGGSQSAVLLVSVRGHLPEERLSAIQRDVRARIAELGLSAQIGRVYLTPGELMGEEEFKLNRSRLKRDFAAGKIAEAKAARAGAERLDDGVLSRVIDIFAAALGREREEISPETDFFLDGGGTSLDYFAMAARLSEEFGVSLPTEAGGSLSAPEPIADYIRAGKSDAD